MYTTRSATSMPPFLVAAILALATQAAAQQIPLASARSDHPDEREPPRFDVAGSPEQIVRLAYRHLQELTGESGLEVTFELSDIRTIPADDFDQFRLRELVTLSPTRRIQVVRHEVFDADGELIGVSYRAAWIDAPPPDPLAVASYDPTLNEALADRREAGATDSVTAITAYRVRASLLGQDTSYRAYFLWHRLPPAENASFIVNDLVTDRVGETLSERSPVAAPEELEHEMKRRMDQRTHELERNGSIGFNPSCFQSHRTYYYPVASTHGYQGHDNGFHYAGVAINFTCDCSNECMSINTPAFAGSGCYDHGDLTDPSIQHRARVSTTMRPGQKPNAFQGLGARSAIGQACFVQACRGGGCSQQYSIGVDFPDLGGVSFSFSGQYLLWDGQISFDPSCAACVQAPPVPLRRGHSGRGPFQRNADPGQGGWGGGSSGCWLAVFRCTPIQADPSMCQGQTPCFVESCETICIE
jgi:hypothetical protein